MTRPYSAWVLVLPLGSLLWLVAGCGSAPSGDYQTFTSEDADRVDQAREERAAAEAEPAPSASRETQERSAVVLAAAQSVAAAVSEVVEEDDVADTASAASEIPEVSPDVETSRPRMDRAPSERGASLVEIAGSKVAGAIRQEPVVRTIQLLIPDRSFTVEGPDDAIRISYDDFDLLKVLNMEPVPTNAVDHFPPWLSNLDGQRVRLRGFMYPTFQESGIPAFVLARDNQICCFGRNPKIYDLVEVTLRDGVTTDYIQGRPFDVVGNFHIRPEADGDELWQLYQLDDAVIVDE